MSQDWLIAKPGFESKAFLQKKAPSPRNLLSPRQTRELGDCGFRMVTSRGCGESCGGGSLQGRLWPHSCRTEWPLRGLGITCPSSNLMRLNGTLSQTRVLWTAGLDWPALGTSMNLCIWKRHLHNCTAALHSERTGWMRNHPRLLANREIWPVSAVSSVLELFCQWEERRPVWIRVIWNRSASLWMVKAVSPDFRGGHPKCNSVLYSLCGQPCKVVKATISGNRPGFEFGPCSAVCWLCDIGQVT